MKQVSASLTVELWVECPHCEHYFDLIEHPVNVEHSITNQATEFGDAHKDFEEEVSCPDCKGEFKAVGIEW